MAPFAEGQGQICPQLLLVPNDEGASGHLPTLVPLCNHVASAFGQGHALPLAFRVGRAAKSLEERGPRCRPGSQQHNCRARRPALWQPAVSVAIAVE